MLCDIYVFSSRSKLVTLNPSAGTRLNPVEVGRCQARFSPSVEQYMKEKWARSPAEAIEPIGVICPRTTHCGSRPALGLEVETANRLLLPVYFPARSTPDDHGEQPHRIGKMPPRRSVAQEPGQVNTYIGINNARKILDVNSSRLRMHLSGRLFDACSLLLEFGTMPAEDQLGHFGSRVHHYRSVSQPPGTFTPGTVWQCMKSSISNEPWR